MAERDDALRAVIVDWLARRDATEAAFRKIRFGEKGYFQRAVSAVTPMLEQALAARPKSQVGQSFVEALPMLMRSEQAEVTNETVQQLVDKAATDFYSYQELAYLALNPVLLRHLPALRDWQLQTYLGSITPPARPRGHHANANYFRDNAICNAIIKLEEIGFTPYRGKLHTSTCASDVVVEALAQCGQNVSYDAVARIWRGRDGLKASAAGTGLANDLTQQLLKILSDSNQA